MHKIYRETVLIPNTEMVGIMTSMPGKIHLPPTLLRPSYLLHPHLASFNLLEVMDEADEVPAALDSESESLRLPTILSV